MHGCPVRFFYKRKSPCSAKLTRIINIKRHARIRSVLVKYYAHISTAVTMTCDRETSGVHVETKVRLFYHLLIIIIAAVKHMSLEMRDMSMQQ